MNSTSKQLAVRAREFAARTIASLGNRDLIEDFLDGYATEYDRQGLAGTPARRRELLETLHREALLAMVACAQGQLPRHLTRRRPPVLKGAEVRAAESFRQEILAALAQSLRWGPEDVEEFRRDLDLYAQMGARQPGSMDARNSAGTLRTSRSPHEGPFLDRMALLLDPSLMEKARRAAGKLLQKIESLAEESLGKIFLARPTPKRTKSV